MTTQYELNFEPGLTDVFPRFSHCLSASVYSCGRAFKNIAADLDMSPSKLSRMLSESDESINFPAQRLADLIEATGDLRPIYWLVEKFCEDADAAARRSISELAAMLPKIQTLIESAGGPNESEGS